jgi:hypothetical protein
MEYKVLCCISVHYQSRMTGLCQVSISLSISLSHSLSLTHSLSHSLSLSLWPSGHSSACINVHTQNTDIHPSSRPRKPCALSGTGSTQGGHGADQGAQPDGGTAGRVGGAGGRRRAGGRAGGRRGRSKAGPPGAPGFERPSCIRCVDSACAVRTQIPKCMLERRTPTG